MHNGKPVYKQDWPNIRVHEGDSLEFRAVAAGGRTFRLFAVLALAIAAPMIAQSLLSSGVGFATLGGAAAAGASLTIGGLSATATAALVTAGINLAGTALINAISPIPEQPVVPPSSPSEAQKFINGANNPLAQWGSIPVVLGKTRITPPLGAVNNVRFTSDEDILNKSGNIGSGGVAATDTFVDMLLIWGYGPVVIDQRTLRIGQVGFYNLDASGNIIVNANGTLSQNYTNAKQITLDRITEPSAVTLSAFDAIYGRDNQQFFPSLQLNYDGLPPIGRTGGLLKISSPPPWTPQPRPTTDAGWAEYAFSQPSDSISVSVSFPQGLRATIVQGDGAGSDRAAPVGLELSYKIGTGAWTPWPTGTSGPGLFTVGGQVATSSASSTWSEILYDSEGGTQYVTNTETRLQNQILAGSMVRDGFTWTCTLNRVISGGAVPLTRWNPDALISVRIRRTTGDNAEPTSSWRYTHIAVLQTVTSTRNTKPAVDPQGAKIAKTAITLQATDEINGQVDGINAVVQTYCLDWNSATQTWVTRATSNPASLFRYVLQHPANPQPVTDSQLDLVQLQHWHEYCSTQRTLIYNGITYQYNLQYNSVLAGGQRSVLEVLREIASAGRASPSMLDGKWSVVIDEPKPVITQHFSPHNSWGFEATKMLPRLPGALKVQFNDRDSEYVQKEIIVSYSNTSATSAQLLESISLPGVTSVAEAVSHAKWHLAQIKLRPEVYVLNTDIEYIVCNRGDRVKVSHYVPRWGGGSGRVKNIYGQATNSIQILELDELVLVDASVENAVLVRSSLGVSIQRKVKKYFNIFEFAHQDYLVTIYTVSPHPFSSGNQVSISSSEPGVINGNYTIKDIVYIDGLPMGITIEVYDLGSFAQNAVSGTISLTTSNYSKIALEVPTENIQAGDLFLFGRFNLEAQDLIVTKIEPTSSKSARVIMVDYGVTPTYNIFNDYSGDTITSGTIFESQVSTVIELAQQVGNSIPIVDPARFVSNETVMRVLAPGIFEYVIRVPFQNPAGLSNDIGFVQAEVYPSNNLDSSGSIKYTVPVLSSSIDLTGLVEGEIYRFRLRYITKLGKVGQWTEWYDYFVEGKRTPPGQVQYSGTGYTIQQDVLKLFWNSNPEVDIAYYEVRTEDVGWGDSQYILRALTTELPVTPTQPGLTDTWYIKAVDYAGNYSTLATQISYTYPSVPNITSIIETYSNSSLTEAAVALSWAPITNSAFGVSAYIIEYGDVSLRSNTTSITVPANWLGSRTFTIKVLDILGNPSTGFSKLVQKLPPNPVLGFRVQVIDNNVLLYWTNAARTTLPIAHALIKRSSIDGTWATAEVVGTKSGEFTSFSELVSGEYIYYVAAVDTDGRESVPVQAAVRVAQPPDFVFYGAHTSTFESKPNVLATYTNAVKYDGELLMPVSRTETYSEHFTSPDPDWVSPQSQISAGYPYYIQPGVGSGSYVEEIDFLTVIGSSQLNLTILGTNLVGSCTTAVQLYTKSNPGDDYIPTTGFATNFRYVKIVVSAAQNTTGSIYRVSNIYLTLSSKQITESSKLQVNGFAIVNFEKEFIDVSSITLTASGTTPVNAVYDFKDAVFYSTYTVSSNVCSITTPIDHGLVAGQKVRLYFTTGTAPSGVYIVSTVPNVTQFNITLVTTNTSGAVTAYPNSMVVYAFDPQTGSTASTEISYLIRGY